MHHVQRHVLGLEGHALLRGPHLQHHAVAGRDLGGRLAQHTPVEGDRALRKQLLQIAARELGHAFGQHLVGAQAVLGGRHGDFAQLGGGGLDLATFGVGLVLVLDRFRQRFAGRRRNKPLRGRGLSGLPGAAAHQREGR